MPLPSSASRAFARSTMRAPSVSSSPHHRPNANESPITSRRFSFAGFVAGSSGPRVRWGETRKRQPSTVASAPGRIA